MTKAKHRQGDTIHVNLTGIICGIDTNYKDEVTYKLMDNTGTYIAWGIPEQYTVEEEKERKV